MISFILKKGIYLLGFLFLLSLQNCKGGQCAASLTPGTDLDSDCTVDASDNCPFTYNPLQRDTDENGIGDSCEDDEAVSSALSSLSQNKISYTKPHYDMADPSTKELHPSDFETCLGYFLVGCHGQMIGIFDDVDDSTSLFNKEGPFGDESSPYSVFNPDSTFGSENGVCSAFNATAPLPPAFYCFDESHHHQRLGYLSNNTEVRERFEPCAVFSEFENMPSFCYEK